MTATNLTPTTTPTNALASAPAFVFTPENKQRIKAMTAKYPKGREASAVLPVLDLAQRQNNNWLSQTAIEAVAEALAMPAMRVMEVASFYSMFNLKPVGKYFIQCCRTTPCWLMGSDEVARAVKDRLGIGPGETSDCGRFTFVEVECLGACVNAPMVQINDEYYEDLDYVRMKWLIDTLANGEMPNPGSVKGRQGSKAQAKSMAKPMPHSLPESGAKSLAKSETKSGAKSGAKSTPTGKKRGGGKHA